MHTKNQFKGYYVIQIKKNVVSFLDISANNIFDYVKILRHAVFFFKNSNFKYIDIWLDIENASLKLKFALFISGFIIFYKVKKIILFYSHLQYYLNSILIKKILLR